MLPATAHLQKRGGWIRIAPRLLPEYCHAPQRGYDKSCAWLTPTSGAEKLVARGRQHKPSPARKRCRLPKRLLLGRDGDQESCVRRLRFLRSARNKRRQPRKRR